MLSAARLAPREVQANGAGRAGAAAAAGTSGTSSCSASSQWGLGLGLPSCPQGLSASPSACLSLAQTLLAFQKSLNARSTTQAGASPRPCLLAPQKQPQGWPSAPSNAGSCTDLRNLA